MAARVTRRCLRLVAGLVAAGAVAACQTPLNLLAALDGPYISPERRAEIAYREAQERQAWAATPPAPAPSATPAPTPAMMATAAPAAAPVSAPAPAPVRAPAPVLVAPASPISPSAGLMGPVVVREGAGPAPAPRLPSASGLTPSPTAPTRARPEPAAAPSSPPSGELQRAAAAAGLTVVSTLPTPEAAAAAGPPGARENSQLRAFYDFAVARLDAPPAAGGRLSMLLADPPSLDPELKRCGNLPPAVLVDVDPGNGLLPLVSNDTGNPELTRYLGLLRERGVTVFWISGHGPGQASQIRQRLVASGLDPTGTDPLVVTRFAGESKQARRYALGETNCVLSILGDQRSDFDELYDFVLDPIMAAPLEEHVNRGWFLTPPPLD
jgi:hypothetical protein